MVAIMVVIMFVDDCRRGKYRRVLLRDSYRENGKVKHNTIANISQCSDEEIEAIKLALRYKNNLAALTTIDKAVSCKQGLSVGAVWLLYSVAKRIGIVDALGSSRQGKLALWQVIARVIDQGSRLSAVRLAGSHAACDILGLTSFNEDDLYKNLDWLAKHQDSIEDRLFKRLCSQNSSEDKGLYLYDVTSSYLEGSCNELGAFGYNRDGKKGKQQIVIGLLCNDKGDPLSIEVFRGNTQDPKTVASQVRKVADRFGGKSVTFVGDRGMLKSQQIEGLSDEGFHYITAITKPQIESLLKERVVQLGLFDHDLAEVEGEDGVRYILRRNPVRAQEMRYIRHDKLRAFKSKLEQQNRYLQEHPRAKEEVALRKLEEYRQKLNLTWVTLSAIERGIVMTEDEKLLAEVSKLDGCYVLKTDLSRQEASKETIHSRYKDLGLVEKAFRTSKTVHLEMRPVHVHLASRTRGHAFVVMLAYRIVKELARCWKGFDLTVEEGIKQLSGLCAIEMRIKGKASCHKIPEPRDELEQLLKAADVRLPNVLPCSGVRVATRKKLADRRKTP
jgi:transposase